MNPLITCACGCGTVMTLYDKYHRPRKYFYRHQRMRPDISSAFWKNVLKTDSCWLWTGAKSKAGYGQLGHRKKVLYAHRVSFELHKGVVPKGMVVCHTCDNPQCVNPEHLFVGTHCDNMHDAIDKNRLPGTKISDSTVEAIRRDYGDNIPISKIAVQYDVSQTAAWRIAHRQRRACHSNL